MDTHHDDPTGEAPPPVEPEQEDTGTASADPWDEAADRFKTLGEKLREQYREIAGDEGPSEGEVKDAFRTLGSAFERVMDAVGSAFRNPDVRDQTKQAASSLVSALGATFEELGEELKRATKRGEHEAPGEEGEDVEVEVEFDEWGIEITDDDSSDEDGTPAG